MHLFRRNDDGPWWFEFQYGGTRYRESTGTRDKREAGRVATQRRAGIQAGEPTYRNRLREARLMDLFAREQRGMPIAEPKWTPLPERGRKRVKAWTEDQARRFLEVCAAHSPAVLGVMTFLLNTGCRKGEAIALTWENVDLRRGFVRIWPSAEWSPKNDEPREIPMSSALEPWLNVAEKNRSHPQWVFPSPAGERYAGFPRRGFDRTRRLTAEWTCSKCRAPREIIPTGQRSLAVFAPKCECRSVKWTEKRKALVGGPHTLRHTFATAFLARCPDLFLLGRIMGHSHERVTELYAHLLPDHLARARNVVDLSAPTPTAPEERESA